MIMKEYFLKQKEVLIENSKVGKSQLIESVRAFVEAAGGNVFAKDVVLFKQDNTGAIKGTIKTYLVLYIGDDGKFYAAIYSSKTGERVVADLEVENFTYDELTNVIKGIIFADEKEEEPEDEPVDNEIVIHELLHALQRSGSKNNITVNINGKDYSVEQLSKLLK